MSPVKAVPWLSPLFRLAVVSALLFLTIGSAGAQTGETLIFHAQFDPEIGTFNHFWFHTDNWFKTDSQGQLVHVGHVPGVNDTAVIDDFADVGGATGIQVRELRLPQIGRLKNGNFTVDNLTLQGGVPTAAFMENLTMRVRTQMIVNGVGSGISACNLTIDPLAAARVEPNSSLSLSSGTLISNQGSFILSDGAGLTSLSSGGSRLNILPNADLSANGSAVISALVLDNRGTVKANSNGTLAFQGGMVYTNTGTGKGTFKAVVAGAMLHFQSGFGFASGITFTFAGPGLSRIDSGLNMQGNINVGTVDAGGNVIEAGRLEINGGSIDGAGTLRVAANSSLHSTLTLSNDNTFVTSFTGAVNVDSGGRLNLMTVTGSSFRLNNGTINNRGTAVLTGTGDFHMGASAIINNLVGGVFDIQNDRFLSTGGFVGNAVFNNAGLLKKSAGTGSSLGVALNNTGSVQALAGALFITNGSSSGEFVASSGCEIQVYNGTYNLNAGTTIVGAGFFTVKGGTLKRNTNLTASNFGVGNNTFVGSSGIFDGTGSLNVTGTFNWSEGTIQGSGPITIASGGTLNINGDYNGNNGTGHKRLSGTTINNLGATIWTGTGTIIASNGAIFNNQTGATFNSAHGSTVNGGGGNLLTFNNDGIVNPGASPGLLVLNGQYLQKVGGKLNIELGGLTAGTQYDQLQVGGAVTLGGTLSLNVINGFTPASNATFVIINNDGSDAISGTFSGLAEGSLINAVGRSFRITYTGGDGNDVVLTHLPRLTIGDVTVTEGNSGTVSATFTLTLSQSSTQAITVQYATFNISAVAGSDYNAGSDTLTFAAGATTRSVSVQVQGDVLDEENESFRINLSNATNAVITDAQGIGTITDDDAAPSFTVSNPRAFLEGSAASPGSTTFGVRLSAPSGKTVTVNYQTADGLVNGAVAGQDYVAASGTVTFAPGQTLKTVTVPFIGEAIAELNEQFFLDIKTPVNATITASRGKAFIGNDDGPSISIDNAVSVQEGNSGTKAQQFIVRLGATSTNTVTVSWATGNGPATGGGGPVDFTAATGTLTFEAGEVQKTITIQVKGDTTVEPTEKYFVNLTRPTFAVIADSQGSGFILNDDASAGIAAPDEPSR